MKKWLIVLAVLMLIGLALLAANVLADFVDIPCQDGIWDAARKTCVPD
jgi:hypothetical protein